MNGLQNLLKHWTRLWSSWTALERASVAGGVALCIALVAGVGFWATRPEFVTLADHLSPSSSAEIISTLEGQGIEYRLNFAGSAVLVPRALISKARLVIKDVAPGAATAESSSFSDGLWADPALTHVRLLRDQEQRLARSIMQIRTVRNATVHLTQTEPSPFIRNRAPTKASVILDLHPGAPFSASDAQSIVLLVSHGVEGLDPENISVLDTEGRHLSSAKGFETNVSGQLEFRQRLETELASKAETMLAQMLGPGSAVVRVTTDVDFRESTREETTFDPSAKVKTSEEIETETTSGSTSGGGGPAGTTANMGGQGAGSQSNNGVASKRERNNTQYENAKIVDRVVEAPGTVKRMTVAAVVHPPVPKEGEKPVELESQKSAIENIIKQAVGFDAARSDQIEVMIAPRLADPLASPLAPASGWEQYEGMIRTASLGIASVVALIVGFLILKRLRPMAVEVPANEGLSLEAAQRLADLSRKVRQQPAAAAKVISAWLEESEEQTEGRTEGRTRAAA